MVSHLAMRERSASTYPCRSRAEAFKRTGLMESYSSRSKSPMTKRRTDDTSAFNTCTVGEDVSSFLIPQGEGEVDGDPAARRRGGGSSGDLGRASPSSARGRGVTGGRGRRQGLGSCCPPFPPLYIGPRERGGAALALPPRKGAARGESFPPKAPRRCLPPLGLSVFLISWHMGLLGLVPLAHIGQGAPPTAHVPPGAGGPPWWTPGPLSALPVQYR